MRMLFVLLLALLTISALGHAIEVQPPGDLHCVYGYGHKLDAPFVVERIGDTIFLNRLPLRPVRTPGKGPLDLAAVTPDYEWYADHARHCERVHLQARTAAAAHLELRDYVATYAASLRADPYVRQVRPSGERALIIDWDCDRPCCRHGRIVFDDPLPPVDSTAMLEAQVDEIADLLARGGGIVFGYRQRPYEVLVSSSRVPRVISAISELLAGQSPDAALMHSLPLSNERFVEDLVAAGRKRE